MSDKKSLALLLIALVMMMALFMPVSVFADKGFGGGDDGGDDMEPAWIYPEMRRAYPRVGGIWMYGYHGFAIHSYYVVDLAHGSSVMLDGYLVRSRITRPGVMSIAEISVYHNKADTDDRYYYRLYR